MRRIQSIVLAACFLAFAFSFTIHATPMSLSLDATDVGRGLLRSTMTFEVSGSEAEFLYPEWIQGTHAPSGVVANIGELKFFTANGEPLEWERDPLDVYRFKVKFPSGTTTLKAELVYLCNQPTVNSEGVDSYGNGWLGVVNWNTVALYPSQANCDELTVEASLRLPEGWRLASALAEEKRDGETVHFQDVTFSTLLDSPAIFGQYLRSIPLTVESMPPVHLHLVSESEGAIQIPDSLIETYTNVVKEAGLLFGGAPFDEYHFLVTCSDMIGGNGLEHARSSFNGVGERDLLDEKQIRGWVGYLLPHEFVHAWVGKYRRPDGMTKPEFRSPLDTSMLWVYEGLTQYLGLVLCARSGMWTPEHYREMLAGDVSWMMNRKGRAWRNLEDTARASHTLRGHSKHWGAMRRGQDYYDEGALWWMEADAIIRGLSDGQKSLDDFCAAFFGPAHGADPVVPFTREEMLKALNATAEYDWERFFYLRINQSHEELPSEFPARLGYRLQYANQPDNALTESEELYNFTAEEHSLGASFGSDGAIRSTLTPGMPLEKAGLAPGMKVVAVNSRAFTKERLRDAIADSVSTRQIELLVLDGDTYRTYTVEYDGGPRYLQLVRDEDRPDILGQIITPKAQNE
jgi:predicted metalloprotease with PDZ domain